MASPFTLRLDEKTRQRISRMARRRNVSASDVVRNAIESMADREELATEPYKLIADLIGTVHGGNPRRSENTGLQFGRLLKSRRSRKKK
jgi:Arc/MetJ-type ribon-helix-helix transcriptional regulator